jgi:hypothetical protein
VIYDEQENFQSVKYLKNFNYPFSNRKKVRDEYYALLPTNDTTNFVETHKIYLQRSVTCLQDKWWRVFAFIMDGVEILKDKYGKVESDDITYECDEPMIKFKYHSSQVTTKRENLK